MLKVNTDFSVQSYEEWEVGQKNFMEQNDCM